MNKCPIIAWGLGPSFPLNEDKQKPKKQKDRQQKSKEKKEKKRNETKIWWCAERFTLIDGASRLLVLLFTIICRTFLHFSKIPGFIVNPVTSLNGKSTLTIRGLKSLYMWWFSGRRDSASHQHQIIKFLQSTNSQHQIIYSSLSPPKKKKFYSFFQVQKQ